MEDYVYDKHAVELDRRLEKVMESHTKGAQTQPEETPSGLQSFIERQTIAEEIASIPKVAVSLDANIERAREKVAEIVEARASAFDDFLATSTPVVDAVKTAAAEHAELSAHRQDLVER